jgi:predicted ArsR family transcriptional regulator
MARVGKQADDIARIALLSEPSRRRLYDYIRGRGEPVGRDEAARVARISRSLAAFHLDRLAAAGLLETEYRRISGLTGRGAGRPAKLYSLSGRRVTVSLPENRYDVAGTVFVRMIEAGRGQAVRRGIRAVARDRGLEMGRELSARVGTGKPLRRAERALEELGYRPQRRKDVVRPRNCPFHDLVREAPQVVCAMNHALLAGLAAGLRTKAPGPEGRILAESDPDDGACCVRLRLVGSPGRPKS